MTSGQKQSSQIDNREVDWRSLTFDTDASLWIFGNRCQLFVDKNIWIFLFKLNEFNFTLLRR